ncbi:helix-turn-helix domain-containing protein [Limimaricola sp. G21655-S1]|uniref:helix-turn-helix domain-containing protein n=1 Tax=Limimaricola sp. G21655-S1 TaxID=3014768 RepID=UPI0022AF66C4|nr:helix-turn-helix domain-containing protein [Limimaricola sp. G21655-S1]MCZ4263018.1 helix-turn-helix domain-containing protein [Limimaricola sp. G21655-S1]
MPRTLAPDLETLLTIQQVAELENVSPKTIRRRIKSGGLPAIRNGRLLRIRPQDLRSYRLRQMLGE